MNHHYGSLEFCAETCMWLGQAGSHCNIEAEIAVAICWICQEHQHTRWCSAAADYQLKTIMSQYCIIYNNGMTLTERSDLCIHYECKSVSLKHNQMQLSGKSSQICTCSCSVFTSLLQPSDFSELFLCCDNNPQSLLDWHLSILSKFPVVQPCMKTCCLLPARSSVLNLIGICLSACLHSYWLDWYPRF